MQNNFFSYVDEADAKFLAIESAYDIEMDRIQLALEYADRLCDIKFKEADLKVLTESGTKDDLDSYYEDVAAQTSAQKDGLLKRICDAIRKLIEGIANAISSLFGKKLEDEVKNAPDTPVVIEGNPSAVMNAFEKAYNDARKFIGKGFTKDDGNGNRVFSIGKTLTTALAAAGVGFSVFKGLGALKNRGNKGEAEAKPKETKTSTKNWIQISQWFSKFTSKNKEATDAIETSGMDADAAKEVGNIFSSLQRAASTWIKDTGTKVKSVFHKDKNDADDSTGVSAATGDNQGSDNAPAPKAESVMDYFDRQDYLESCNDILDILENM